MSAPKVASLASLGVVRTFLVYIIARLKTVTDASAVEATYLALRAKWTAIRDKEDALADAVTIGQAAITSADDALDLLIDQLVHVLLVLVGNDRKNALWLHYFGKKTPSQLKNPVLGAELVAVRAWLPSLKSATQPALAALSAGFVAAVAVADAAVLQLATATQENHDFRSIGERHAFVDSINVAGVASFASLDKIRTDKPEKGYATGFASSFFLHRTGTKGLTDVQLDSEITAAKDALATLEKEKAARVVKDGVHVAAETLLHVDEGKLAGDKTTVAQDRHVVATETAQVHKDLEAAKKTVG